MQGSTWMQQGMNKRQRTWEEDFNASGGFGQGMDGWDQSGGLGGAGYMGYGGQGKGGGGKGAGGFKKTKMCNVFVASGFCHKGGSCTFAHGEHELGDPQPSQEEQALWAQVNEGVMVKTRMCNNFINGSCNRGTTCTFAHSQDELGMPQPEGGGKGGGMMGGQQQGGGNKGGGKTRMRICNHWQNGACPRGNMCNFAHGEHEIGTPQPGAGGGPAPAPAAQTNSWSRSNLCGHFEATGFCYNADMCAFAHGEQELGMPLPPGGGKGSLPAGYPTKCVKKRICTQFANGTCSFENCIYAHGLADIGSPSQDRPQWSGPRPSGGVRKRTKICQDWEKSGGMCPRGDVCTFAHGEAQLGTPIDASLLANMQQNSRLKLKMCNAFLKGLCNRGDTCTFAHGEDEIGKTRPGQLPIAPGAPQVMMGGGGGNMQQGGGALKTDICQEFFDAGQCPRGAMCPFIHGEEEIGTPQPQQNRGMNQQQMGQRPSRFSSQPPQQQQQQVKKEICANWQEGKCTYGERCLFAHGEQDMGQQLPAMAAAIMNPQGGGAASPFAQQWKPMTGATAQAASAAAQNTQAQFKRRICTNFANGFCNRGEDCTFAHGEHEIGMAAGQQGGQQQGGQQGQRADGTTPERQMHNFKTSLCNDFSMKGSCPRGETCSFAHGEGELLKPGEALQLMQQMETA